MRSIHKIKTQVHRRYRRHLRVRKKIVGTPERPRLVVFRSSKHIYAQLVDDTRGMTVLGASDRTDGVSPDAKGKTGKSFALGQLIAAKAKEKGIVRVVFDRGGYQYHGRVKAVADGARKGGLEF
jgi:large subunit ribosomal protein L18